MSTQAMPQEVQLAIGRLFRMLMSEPSTAAGRARITSERLCRDWPNRDGLELAIVSSLKVSMYGVSLDRVVDATRGVK